MINNIKVVICISMLMFVIDTSSADIIIFEGEREIKLNNSFKITACKNIGLADCENCVDTPNYYFTLETKQLISSCSGACWHPKGKQRKICETLCPPPQWECGNDS